MKLFRICLLLLISGVAFPFRAVFALEEPASSTQQGPTPHQRAYYFEHKLLPLWVHKTNGAFFDDLQHGEIQKLTEAATQIAGKDFAGGIHVRKISELTDTVLIVFPAPRETPECFFAAVQKTGAQYRYFTLESGEDILSNGTKSFLCEWSGDGRHLDFGPRKFDDEASFISELKNRSNKTPAATFSPPES